uniref:Uncharacterized protein n=1 Tax=Arundo donax TaxID=35708 RepID=A0A0A9FI17_ARUDO
MIEDIIIAEDRLSYSQVLARRYSPFIPVRLQSQDISCSKCFICFVAE